MIIVVILQARIVLSLLLCLLTEKVPHPVLMGGGADPSSLDGGYSRVPSHRKNGATSIRNDWIPSVRKDGVPLIRKDSLPPPPPVGWMRVLPRQLDGVAPPPPKVGQTHACENITSRHPSDASGKNTQSTYSNGRMMTRS